MTAYQNTLAGLFGRFTQEHLVKLGLGRVNYWFTFIADPLTVIFFLVWEIFVSRVNPAFSILSFVAGGFAWTLLEYSFHRWVYHKGETPAHAGHRLHHESPRTLIAMPWFVVSGIFGIVWYVFARLLPAPYVISFAAGVLSGFIFYGLFHHVHHHFDYKSRWYRRMRAHHNIHHRLPNVNFGVTSRFWDHVFGTIYKT